MPKELFKGLGWDAFTDAVIDAVNANCSGVVFLLWGKHAEDKVHPLVCGRREARSLVTRL